MRNLINRSKIPILILFLSFSAVTAFSAPTSKATWQPAGPRVIEPKGDVVQLQGKAGLELKWLLSNTVIIDYTDLRDYKTYDAYEKNLILKAQIPASAYSSYVLKSDILENGQVYTCKLRAVALGGQKSDPVYVSFKVKK